MLADRVVVCSCCCWCVPFCFKFVLCDFSYLPLQANVSAKGEWRRKSFKYFRLFLHSLTHTHTHTDARGTTHTMHLCCVVLVSCLAFGPFHPRFTLRLQVENTQQKRNNNNICFLFPHTHTHRSVCLHTTCTCACCCCISLFFFSCVFVALRSP